MTTNGIIASRVESKHVFPGEWPSGKATDFELIPLKNGMSVLSTGRVATGIDWAFAPDWLALDEACFLSGHDRGFMLQAIEAGCVDLNLDGLIEKQSLWEYQEVLVELAHWDD
jgi:hypothetical protein